MIKAKKPNQRLKKITGGKTVWFCPQCGECYLSIYDLNVHAKKEHGKIYLNVEPCTSQDRIKGKINQIKVY